MTITFASPVELSGASWLLNCLLELGIKVSHKPAVDTVWEARHAHAAARTYVTAAWTSSMSTNSLRRSVRRPARAARSCQGNQDVQLLDAAPEAALQSPRDPLARRRIAAQVDVIADQLEDGGGVLAVAAMGVTRVSKTVRRPLSAAQGVQG